MAKVTTAQILAEKALQTTCGQQCVDWAIGLLEGGSDAEFVSRLAGKLPPFNHFEIADLRDRALCELGLVHTSPESAVNVYAGELLRTALDGDMDLIKAFALIANLYVEHDNPHELRDFYLLYNAYSDLRGDEVQWYWDGATSENVVSIMEERARAFASGDSSPAS